MSLTGYTKRSFTRGLRFAFRKAYGLRHGITDLQRIILTNVRDRTAGSRLLHSNARGLGAPGRVSFDVQVSFGTMVDAGVFKAQEDTGGASTATDIAVLAAFKAEIQVVAASGEFDDVTVNYVAPKALSVVTEEVVAALETGAPTPVPAAAPAANTASPFPLPGAAIGGGIAVLFVVAVAFFLGRRSASGAGPAMQQGTASDNPALHSAVLHEGTLSKKGKGVFGKWQPCHFKLASQCLVYTDKGHKMAHSISLDGVASCAAVGKDIILVVLKSDSSADAGMQTLRAADAQGAAQWSAQINSAMGRSTHNVHINPMQVRRAPDVDHLEGSV
jgi:hypothetical protein